ncbi:hypothetical protein GTA08_BOTSDO01443, partial [Neofusicoccum parvum]
RTLKNKNGAMKIHFYLKKPWQSNLDKHDQDNKHENLLP